MEISSVTTPSAPTAARANNAITSDFTTFLKMLTVQMQNQDPLNPIESSDFAVQLATFSGVEQQVQTNQLLADMMSRLSQSGMADLAGWIGQDARTTAPAQFDGAPLTLSLTPASGADRSVLVVTDASGQLVSREEVPARSGDYQWLGADISGAPLPPGRYSFSLENWQGEEQMETRPVDHYARILEARGGAEGTTLILQGGIEVPAASVTGLRRAD
ncbi:MAG: flagellar hook assembly protein FlgD [Tabrizicola sp.]|nr:flagellar hook assembly protein FlgD [Tabrizicola sp.]